MGWMVIFGMNCVVETQMKRLNCASVLPLALLRGE